MSTSLAERVNYNQVYFESDSLLLEQILSKTVVPYQVEVQPGRIGGEICWMKCPYCYGGSSENVRERLSPERYVDLMQEMLNGPHGSVPKIIYGGYATDPLNYQHIADLVDVSVTGKQVIGFHSKLIKISDRLIDLLSSPEVAETSYFTISVDAGSAESYNKVHALQPKAKVYTRVLENIRNLTSACKSRGSKIEVTANYLVTRENCSPAEVSNGIDALIDAGAQIVRFSFPQIPRGQNENEKTELIPEKSEIDSIKESVTSIVNQYEGKAMVTADPAASARERRTLPCFARFIYPTISFDGYLSNCSQSAAPHFRNMSLGDLSVTGFWEAFYDYDAESLKAFMNRQHEKMTANDCRCDRKEHRVNGQLSAIFDAI